MRFTCLEIRTHSDSLRSTTGGPHHWPRRTTQLVRVLCPLHLPPGAGTPSPVSLYLPTDIEPPENHGAILGLLNTVCRGASYYDQQGSSCRFAPFHPPRLTRPIDQHRAPAAPYGRGNCSTNIALRPRRAIVVSTVRPHTPLPLFTLLTHLTPRWTVAATTISSGLSYVFSKNAVRILSKGPKP